MALAVRESGSKSLAELLAPAFQCLSLARNSEAYSETIMALVSKINWLAFGNVFPFRMIQYGLESLFASALEYWLDSISIQRVSGFQYNDQTLLYYSCACQQVGLVRSLIQAGVEVDITSNAETPLTLAAKLGNADICRILIENGAQLIPKTTHIPLHKAAREGHVKICEILLEQGQRSEQLSRLETLSDMSPLQIATKSLHHGVMELLLYYKADVDQRHPRTGHTALHFAVSANAESECSNRIAAVNILLGAGADIFATCQTMLGDESVIELARASPGLIGHLISRGAHVPSVEEITGKAQELARRAGKICVFDDEPTDQEKAIILGVCKDQPEQSPQNHTVQTSVVFRTKPRAWKTVRLFLSSTFVDMKSEREILIKRVIPRVKEACAKRSIHLVDIDLRWGITEEAVQTGAALEVCLSEASQCDIFCGMIGSRYGWVPEPSQIPQCIADAYQWRDGHSITHMEVQEGVLRRLLPQQTILDNCRALFFFRDESIANSVPSSYQCDFAESDPVSKAGLAKLKNQIRASKQPVFDYCPSFGLQDSFPSFTGLEEFGELFENQVMKAIEELHPSSDENLEDPLEAERSFHRSFIEMRSSSFLGRQHLLQEILTEVEAQIDGSQVLVIHGGAGSGKSSLMATLAHLMCQQNSSHEMFILPHFIGGSPRSISITDTLSRICEELLREFELLEVLATEYETLVQQFRDLLEKVSSHGQKKLVIFIDALNQLDASHRSHNLAWLPQLEIGRAHV